MIHHPDVFQLVGPKIRLPPRSVLVRLKPLGMGTPYRESLSSYYQRLADVHGLTPQVLARELVFSDISQASPNKSFHFEEAWRLPSFNGLVVKEGHWPDRLKSLTRCEGLEDLTLGFLSAFVSTRGLVTKRSKWCPLCLEEDASGSTPYARLLWSFKAVTCCPKHKVNLVSSCGCPKAEWKSSGRVKCLPNVCPRCAGDLGRHDHPKATTPSPKKLLHANMVADLLVSDLANHSTTQERTLGDFLQDSVHMFLDGQAIKLAGLLGVTKSTLSGWINGNHRPDFARILQIAELHGCSLEDVLCGRSGRAKLALTIQKKRSKEPRSRQNRGDIDWKKVVAFLKEALGSDSPLPLTKVAIQVGLRADTLRNAEPDLCSAISDRWHAWRRSCTAQRGLAYADQVRMEAARLANLGHRPTWQRLVEEGFPKASIWQWRTFVQRICDEVWKEFEGSKRIA